MKTRRIAGISVVATTVSLFAGIAIAQDSPVAAELESPPLAEFYEHKWMQFQLSAHGSHLNDLIQSLEEFRSNPPAGDAGTEEWQRLLRDFADTSEQFISLNQAYRSESGRPAEALTEQE